MLQDVMKLPHQLRDRARTAACVSLLMLAAGIPARPQATDQNQPAASTPSGPAAPVITLDEAIHRAQANEPNFVSANAANRIAALDRSIARNGLLPNATFVNGYLYTQGNGQPVPGGTAEQPP